MPDQPAHVAVTIHPNAHTADAYPSRVFESYGTLLGSVSPNDTTVILGTPEAMYALGAALQSIARKTEGQRREEAAA